jgi:hypothetical protein
VVGKAQEIFKKNNLYGNISQLKNFIWVFTACKGDGAKKKL